MNFQDFLKETLQEASEIAVSYFGKIENETTKLKDGNQVLTEADLAIGAHVLAKIESSFPLHNVIDEEAGVVDKDSEFTWVVDPIDGTSNFAVGSPLYGVMIGLLKESEPIAAGVALPSFEEIYIAEQGKGAYCNGELLSVNKTKQLKDSLVVYMLDGYPEAPEMTRREAQIIGQIALSCRNIRTSSSAFDLMLAAKGAYGGVLNQTSKIWDVVAPQLIIEEAGGLFTQFSGKAIDYSSPLSKADDNFTMCCGSPSVHRALQDIIE